MNEKITIFFKQQKNMLLAVGIGALLVGFFIGYEVRGYVIRRAIQDVFQGGLSGVSGISDENKEKETTKEIGKGESFEDGGLVYTLTDIQRGDTTVSLSDNTTRDSKIGFKLKIENKTTEDHSFNDYNFSLKSRTSEDKITKMMFFDDNKNFLPELEGNTLIDGASAEGWITYFLPKEISNSDLQFIFQGSSLKVKFRLN